MKKLIVFILACIPLCAQPSCVSIQDTIYSMGPSGNVLMTGYIELKLGYFTSNGVFTITQSLTTLNITANANNLNTCITPSVVVQANYTVTTGGRTPVKYTTYWYVPNTGGPYRLTGVPSGSVNVSGTPGTALSTGGLNFALVSPNDLVTINGSTLSVSSVQGVSQLTLSSGIGTITGATFTAGPVERGSSRQSGVTPPSIYGPPGPTGPPGIGARFYLQPVTSSTSTVISAATHGLGPNVGVLCSGIAECGSVVVDIYGNVTVAAIVPWTGTIYVVTTGSAYSKTFSSSLTLTLPWLDSGLSLVSMVACYDSSGNQFGQGDTVLAPHTLGIAGLSSYANDLTTTLSASVTQSGRCAFLGD